MILISIITRLISGITKNAFAPIGHFKRGCGEGAMRRLEYGHGPYLPSSDNEKSMDSIVNKVGILVYVIRVDC